jgi:hypothetical protein
MRDSLGGAATAVSCHICSATTSPFARDQVLGRHLVQYYRCATCGFVQTEAPYWLGEAYTGAISGSDVGLVSRNHLLATRTVPLIRCFFHRRGRFLDYGGGYGLFTRMMRDLGFDFCHYDRYCPNLFAQHFEAQIDSSHRYELVTAFEVFEHLVNPLAEIEALLQLSRSILFTTTLLPQAGPRPNDWWYYGLEHGQHVSIYSRESLAYIAKTFKLNLHSDGVSFHLLTDKPLCGILFHVLSRYRVAAVLAPLMSNRSLQSADYGFVTGRDRQ